MNELQDKVRQEENTFFLIFISTEQYAKKDFM